MIGWRGEWQGQRKKRRKAAGGDLLDHDEGEGNAGERRGAVAGQAGDGQPPPCGGPARPIFCPISATVSAAHRLQSTSCSHGRSAAWQEPGLVLLVAINGACTAEPGAKRPRCSQAGRSPAGFALAKLLTTGAGVPLQSSAPPPPAGAELPRKVNPSR